MNEERSESFKNIASIIGEIMDTEIDGEEQCVMILEEIYQKGYKEGYKQGMIDGTSYMG